MKSTVDQIRARFDNEVERFSNLETGQTATVDARLCMDLVAAAAAAVSPDARDLLDIGCGAGNYTLRVLEELAAESGNAGMPDINCTLVDLSLPMLTRATERVSLRTAGKVHAMQGDMRQVDLGNQSFDLIISAATLHHLRTHEEWQATFAKIFHALRPGGSFWVFDLIEQVNPKIESLMRDRYGTYLENLKGGGDTGRTYRETVFKYIAEEDTPRPVTYQLRLLREAGFTDEELLHKNVSFAAFGARRPL
jgi:tRNA (cmo5U34)-methyltransferase